MFQRLAEADQKVIETDIGMLPDLLSILQLLKTRTDVNSAAIDVAQLAQNALFKWASLAGERAYRGIAKFAEIFDPVEYVELFLAQREIRAVMLRQATGPTPVNLVFSRFHDESQDITDKVIFRGARENLPEDAKDSALALVQDQIRDTGLIVINTVYDTPMFHAALEWATIVQAKQEAEKKGTGWQQFQRICPVLLVLTTRNLGHFSNQELLESRYKGLKNLYVLFNESEFGEYIQVHDPEVAKEFLTQIKSGLAPDKGPLWHLLRRYHDIVPGTDKTVIVTFGPIGSIGVTEQHVIYVGTYSVPGKHIYGTNGCGDAYAAGVALLVYHKHNQDWEDITSLAYLRPPPDDSKSSDVLLMMQLGTAAAYAKATHPIGLVTRHDVHLLLERAYLPTARSLGLERPERGTIEQPETARLVQMKGILPQILNG